MEEAGDAFYEEQDSMLHQSEALISVGFLEMSLLREGCTRSSADMVKVAW